MTKLRIAAALAAMTITATTVSAVAQTSPPQNMPHHGRHGGGMLAKADANKDGTITQAEFVAMAQQRFARMDANHDGRIDAAERQLMRDKRHERMAQWRVRRGAPMQPGQMPPAPPAQ